MKPKARPGSPSLHMLHTQSDVFSIVLRTAIGSMCPKLGPWCSRPVCEAMDVPVETVVAAGCVL
jgi:hypothetical protein